MTVVQDFSAVAPFDKRQVAAAFSRAAATYDAVAHLQRAVGESLWARANFASNLQCALDLGSGTGCFTPKLQAQARLTLSLDLAFGMLAYARARYAGAAPLMVQADAEALPLKAGSVDAIFSSLALQWCPHLDKLARSLARVLAPGGRLALASLGPQTLHELRESFARVDDHVHVNQFAPTDALIAPLERAGLRVVSHAVERRTLHFAGLAQLLRELKQLGATNVNHGRAAGLTTRAQLQALADAYERYRTPAGLPATYEVVYLVAERM